MDAKAQVTRKLISMCGTWDGFAIQLKEEEELYLALKPERRSETLRWIQLTPTNFEKVMYCLYNPSDFLGVYAVQEKLKLPTQGLHISPQRKYEGALEAPYFRPYENMVLNAIDVGIPVEKLYDG